MVFSSIPFLFFFLPIFLILYYLVPFKLKNIILLIFSLIFYAWGEPVYIVLMIFSSIVDYFNGRLIEKYPNKKKIFMIFSVIVNLSLLGFFKYSNFLIDNINKLLSLNIKSLNLSLPIGISFFTFQTMSYSIDVYRGKFKAEKNFLNFMTYVSMFPQLIAGPIVRYEDVSLELSKRKINFDNFNFGLIRFLEGLFKKVLIANSVGFIFTSITNMQYNEISVLTAWLAIFAFSFQIYFDFSGYSDMAIGIGKMLGFNYPENFNYPFIAKSITDFWRRWHMSLSSFFKDYVYIPLGGNRKNQFRNILIVWMLTGLWHGASWNFIIWGIYFGVLLIGEKYIFNKYLNKIPNVIKHITTILLIVISFYIFAFDNMNLLVSFGKILFGFSGNSFIDNTFMFYITNYLITLIIATLFSTPIYKIFKERVKVNGIIILIVYSILFILTVSFLVSDTYNPFLYFRF
ncbi:MAG: MBOAT family protein [Firmicutes bacterium]|nr:MBOAT family protein [Bacillota bacterium]